MRTPSQTTRNRREASELPKGASRAGASLFLWGGGKWVVVSGCCSIRAAYRFSLVDLTWTRGGVEGSRSECVTTSRSRPMVCRTAICSSSNRRSVFGSGSSAGRRDRGVRPLLAVRPWILNVWGGAPSGSGSPDDEFRCIGVIEVTEGSPRSKQTRRRLDPVRPDVYREWLVCV